MAEHTPGPWTIYDQTDPHHIKIKGQYADIGGAHVADILGEANARLIAAAPDLLAALKAFMHADGHDDFEDEWPAARAAIAKAEGLTLREKT